MTNEPARAAERHVDDQLDDQLDSHQPSRDEEQQPAPVIPLATGEKPSIWRVLKDQRKALLVALGLVVASFWVLGQLDRWALGASIACGVLLGVVNHVATELWLLRLITSGDQPTRNKMIAATLVRLGVLTVVAVGLAIVFWPDGVGLLLGLAVYRLISLLMTSVTLLKELKSQ
jgi:hypothetical protein